jgi:periplasmic protein TonB
MMKKIFFLFLFAALMGVRGYAQTNLSQPPPPPPPVDRSDSNAVYTYADVIAEFPGGYDSMACYIYTNLNYPESERKTKIEGSVYISFIIEKDGSLSDFSVSKPLHGHPVFDEEAMRVMKAMPRWNPAINEGKPVRMAVTVPIRFTLKKTKKRC